MTVYGTLPHVGDTAVRTSASRGSEWAPIMTGPIQVQAGDGIDPSQVTIEYSTSYNPCRGEVMERGKSEADAPAGCDNNWTSNPSSWSDVKSYRIYINGKTNPIEGGASIPLIVPIKAPDNANGVAYESVAIAATQASSNQAVFPSEPFKVAVASAFDVVLNKTVSSDASALSPGDEVTFRVDAANTGQGLSANTKVLEKLPDGVTFVKSESFMCPTGYVSGTPDACEAGAAAGTYDVNSGVWTIGDLTAGSHASLYVTVRLNDGTDGKTITNNVEFKDLPPYDVNLNNNKASTSITVKHRLAGKVYFDKNDSSSYTAGEEGFNGVTVNLVDAAGAVVATTTTDADGNYSFAKLGAGTYTVKVVKDGDLANLTQTEDPDGTKDNASGAITLNTDNPVRENVNFGYVKKHAISGNIYLDENRDKTKNGDDVNLSGVMVTLVDGSGNVVATTTTDASGNYNFPGLTDGTYTVKVDTTGKLAGLEQTEDPSGAKNSQSTPITFTRNDPDVTNVNFGYVPDYSIAGNVYRDSNRSESKDATETVFQGVTVNLVDASGNVVATTTTDADGNYSFSKLPAGDYTVKVVKDGAIKDMDQTEDPDGTKDNASGKISIGADNPTQTGVNFGYNPNNTIKGSVYRDDNRSSSRDGSEEGYQGQTVQLLDQDGNVVATTTTAADGSYSFEHLPDGTYSVKVVKDGALTDTEQTEDPDGTKDNASEPITLDPTQSVKEGVNFGYVPDYSLSGTIYRDGNRSASHDSTENPYAGVTVNLLDSAGNVVATTTTDANGGYSFSKLPAGDYRVKVDTTGTLKGLDQTEDPDGVADSTSGTISLNNTNRTQSGVNFGYIENNSISGTIFRDEARNGVKDPSDPRFPSVKVTLLDENGNVVETTTTDSNGAYKFSHLPDGKYRVKVDTTGVLNGLEQTLDPDTLKDSQSELIELGESNPTVENVDFGYMEKEVPAAPQPPKQPNPKTPASKLARTGVEAGVLSVGLAALIAGGALLALRRRGRIS